MKQKDQGEAALTIYLEKGTSRVVAYAWEWPGWCRYGKTMEKALNALIESGARYGRIVEQAGLTFEVPQDHQIVEVEGTSNSDWAPSIILEADRAPQNEAEGERRAKLLQTAWNILDQVIAASSATLRKGPRGGGRDRDEVAQHVFEAERSSARKIRISQPTFAFTDQSTLAGFHARILAVLSAPSDGSLLTPKGWPPAYAFRRFAWHVIDHVWEIEDRQE
jgi:hypothetical protein